MKYESLTVLIPSHSLEDLPSDLPEGQAEGLLNAFAVAWHPLLLDSAGVKPNWERADSPPENVKDRLFIVPSVAKDWLPCQWAEVARQRGAHIVESVDDRGQLIDRVLEPLQPVAHVDSDLVKDFLALGYCYLQLEVLTRHMRYFSEIDGSRMQAEAVSAARAAIADDRRTAESHLRSCFEMLLEGRERFYPVECYLADLCLLTPETADDAWAELVRSEHYVNYLVTTGDLVTIGEEHPEELQKLKDRWRDGKQEVLGGEWTEQRLALLPLESVLPQFKQGLRSLRELCGRRPTVWLRRRYGVGIQTPQVLDKLGYTAGLHFVLDDGIYPDEEQGRHRWEGCDGSAVDSVSRIPLAADSASAMLKFPQRMAESMDYDQAALLTLARWPKLQTPWLDDLRHMEKYAPVLGRFVTFSDFFRSTEMPGRLSRHKAGDYLSPHLVASVAREEKDPVSRYIDTWRCHHELDAAWWACCQAHLLGGQNADPEAVRLLESLDNSDGPDDPSIHPERGRQIEQANVGFLHKLASSVLGQQGATSGCFLGNPNSFTWRTVMRWPQEFTPAQASPAIIARQPEPKGELLIVELPPCGFAWLPAGGSPIVPSAKSTRLPMAEENSLRNELFEVRLSDLTGGVSQIKTYRRGPNRLSQQIAFRFPREKTVIYGEGDERHEEKTWYSEMRLHTSEVVSLGPACGEIRTTGELVDPTNNVAIARYTQLTRVWMGRPVVEIELELDVDRLPEGDPWSNYFAVRWAWNDPGAALTYSSHEGAHSVTSDRFEAPHFIEIADEGQRTTIHPLGCLFHRKTGPRMMDTILIPAGETRRQFRFVISLDEAFPMEVSRASFQPIVPITVSNGPSSPASGWFFHLDCRNVQMARLMPLVTKDQDELAAANASDPTSPDAATSRRSDELGIKIRLRETEGRPCAAKLQCYRAPVAARQVDFLDQPITDLEIEGDTVTVGLAPFEICDVNLRF